MTNEPQNIYSLRDELQKKLDAVKMTIDMLESGAAVPPPVVNGNTAEMPEFFDKEKQAREVLEFAVSYFKKNDNRRITVKELAQLMVTSGIQIKGKQPGTTVGAIMLRSGKFLFDKGFWSLKEYAA